MKNYNFPYPKKVRDRIRHIQEQYEKLEQPKNAKEFFELTFLATREAQIRCETIFIMIEKDEVDYSSRYVQKEHNKWLSNLSDQLAQLQFATNNITEEEYLKSLIKLHEWDYVLMYILNEHKE